MRIGVRPYRVPFRRPVWTAHGEWGHREGAWVVVADDDGHVGLGEFAPLPFWGTECLEQGLEALRKCRPVDSFDPTDWGLDGHLAPAAYAGLETALLDLAAQRAQSTFLPTLKRSPLPLNGGGQGGGEPGPGVDLRPVRRAPHPDPPPRGGRGSRWQRGQVPVNALLTADRLDDLVASAHQAAADGYRAVKLKVGARPLAEDRARVLAVRRALGPAIALRLDANEAWDRDEAVEALRAMAIARIDYVEQPVEAADVFGLVEVERRSGIPVAADEAASSLARAQACLAVGVRVLVLKPNVLGGLKATAAIAQEADAQGARVILTSAMDRGLVTAGAVHLAAALGLQEPCGLATLDSFEHPAFEGLTIRHGAIAVPSPPGLGLTPLADDLNALIEEMRHGALADA